MRDGQVLAFQRKDYPETWQFPQGGIDMGETAEAAAWREVVEETGLSSDQLQLTAEYPSWLLYEYNGSPAQPSVDVVGQAQRWFVFTFVGDESSIAIDNHEFISWRWMSMDELVPLAPDFKRNVYEQLAPWLSKLQ